MPKWLNFPSAQARHPQISRRDVARPSRQKSMATNWPQRVKPRAWRSARWVCTARWNSIRGKSWSSWLNTLTTRFTVWPPSRLRGGILDQSLP